MTRVARSILCLTAAALLCAARAQASPIFTLLPEAGSSVASPGDTVGWGYEIFNDDPTDWLVIESLSPGLFEQGTYSELFDYPILAPDTTVTAPYVAGLQGLAEFTWDATAPAGFLNSGIFTIGADLWDGDPFAGGLPVSDLFTFTAPYNISTAAETQVPEPPTLALLGIGLACIAALRRRRLARV
jgi:hypothetical protein